MYHLGCRDGMLGYQRQDPYTPWSCNATGWTMVAPGPTTDRGHPVTGDGKQCYCWLDESEGVEEISFRLEPCPRLLLLQVARHPFVLWLGHRVPPVSGESNPKLPVGSQRCHVCNWIPETIRDNI